MSRLFVVALSLSALAACGDPCERLEAASNRVNERCELGLEDDDSEGECTEQEAEAAECALPCVNDAPCSAFDGTDVEASADLLACFADCGIVPG